MGTRRFAGSGRAKAALPSRLRLARARRREPSLDPHWQLWIATNLSRGADPPELLEALMEQGVPRRLAARQIAAVVESPALHVAKWWEKRRAELAARARVLTALRSMAPEIERHERLAADVFFQRYYATNTPVLLTAALEDSPALTKWTPEYFERQYGDVQIEIVEGREGDPYCDRRHTQTKRNTSMAEYARRVRSAGKTNDFYFTARNKNVELEGLAGLRDDIRPPPGYFAPDKRKGAQSFWFGPEGSLTAFHHDPTNILFCQIYGQKRITLAPPTDLGFLCVGEGFYSGKTPGVELPQLHGSPSWEVVLSPGEALFIPALWWHEVEALSVSISFSLLHFERPNNFPGYEP